MPASPPVTILWGPNFANELQINDMTNYICATKGLFGGPPKDILISDTLYNSPFPIREKLRERPFSINLRVMHEPFTSSYNIAITELYRALYNGPIRVVVTRLGIGRVYLDCRLSPGVDGSDTGPDFVIKLVAVDPLYKLSPAPTPITGNTGISPPYSAISIPPYVGSAPAEPVITLEVTGLGQVFDYYKWIPITNPSSYSLHYYPVCIDLGDIRSLVGSQYHELGSGGPVDSRTIKDIRLESPGGARKQVFVRDSGERAGGVWHLDVKVWTVIYSLAPGETKVLRLLHGNPVADFSEIYPENSSVRPMFSMYFSDNSRWEYLEFMPRWDSPQTRNLQWVAQQQAANNIQPINYQHPGFDAATSTNIPGAGARITAYAPTSGIAGLQLTAPVPIRRVDFRPVHGTNSKTPAVVRAIRPDGSWTDDWTSGAADKTALLYNRATAAIGTSILYPGDINGVPSITRGGATLTVGDAILIKLASGLIQRSTIQTINNIAHTITITNPLVDNVSAGATLQQFFYTIYFTPLEWAAGDYPRTIVFGLRGDHPELTSGDWFFGGADGAKIYLSDSEHVTVTVGSSVNIHDNSKYQLSGRFGNTATSEFVRINTIVKIFDKIEINCKEREVYFYEYVDGVYLPKVKLFECIQFEAVREHWIHIDPALTTNNITFIAGDKANFRNLAITVAYDVEYF